MSHIAPVQQSETSARSDASSGVFRSGKGFVPLGVLGSAASYDMPRQALSSLAQHLGGEIEMDLPPFLVACADGMVIVLTLRVGIEYVGSAVLLSADRLRLLDRGIFELWSRLEKTVEAEDFLKDTAFQISDCLAFIPPLIEADWKSAFC